MEITFDPAKREATLQTRGLDFARAAEVFAGPSAQRRDDRVDYGEDRVITVGFLDEKFVVVVWTPRGADRRIISMRYGHAKEYERWRSFLD